MDVDTVVVRTAGWGFDDKKTEETSESAEESEDTTAEAETGEEAGDSTGTVVNAADFSINVYGIVTSSWSSADESFGEICNNTGGSVSTVGSDSSLSEEICGIIEQVEIVPVSKDVAVLFADCVDKVSVGMGDVHVPCPATVPVEEIYSIVELSLC